MVQIPVQCNFETLLEACLKRTTREEKKECYHEQIGNDLSRYYEKNHHKHYDNLIMDHHKKH